MSLGKDQARINAKLLGGLSNARIGQAISIDWTNYLVLVNINGGQVSVPMVGDAPFPGENVWVAQLGEQYLCLGHVPRATTGTTTGTASGGRISVTADDGRTITVPYVGTAPASGARVVIARDANGVLMGTMSAEPAGVEIYLPPSAGSGGAPGGREGGDATFNPTDSGTWNGSSYYLRDVHCSANERGIWVYGTQIADTIPDDATITTCRIYIDEFFNRFPGTLATLGTHTKKTKSGPPDVSGSLQIPAGSGWRDIRTYANALKTGAALGIGTNLGGYHKFSRGGVHNSGAIYMEWSVPNGG
jgi:hypothetical protein